MNVVLIKYPLNKALNSSTGDFTLIILSID